MLGVRVGAGTGGLAREEARLAGANHRTGVVGSSDRICRSGRRARPGCGRGVWVGAGGAEEGIHDEIRSDTPDHDAAGGGGEGVAGGSGAGVGETGGGELEEVEGGETTEERPTPWVEQQPSRVKRRVRARIL